MTSAASFVRSRVCLAGFSLVALGLSMTLGWHHDYIAYAQHWRWILQGGDPWFGRDGAFNGNAYGPVHAVLALLYAVHPLFPRTVFVGAWLALSSWTWRRMNDGAEAAPPAMAGYLALLLFLNPFFWVFTLAAGTNDVLGAVSCVVAVVEVARRRHAVAGLWLGAGTLLKFVPMLMLPFLAVSWQGRLRWRMLGAFTAIVAGGYASAWVAWGTSAFQPLLFAAERESKMLSIFAFLRGAWSPLRLWTSEPNLDDVSLPCMALAYGLVWAYGLRIRASALLMASLSLFVPLMFYKVGHHQFYAPLFFLLPAWVFSHESARAAQLRLLLRVTAPLAWISFTALVYAATKRYAPPFEWFRETVGFPTFLVSAYGLWVMLRAGATTPARISPW